tara:strand:+ start:931 stop:1362 length:432 start_codon:yes stop_codon:yes gene_type:complete
MNLDQLKEESRKDLIIENEEQLGSESLKNQKIKLKYLDQRSRFQLLLQKTNGEYQRMYRQKWEYYGGKADAKIYVTKPFDIKVLKNDLAMYISSDEEVIQLMDKIGYLEILIKYLEGIIKSIDNRGWDIKNTIEWKKFEAGMI